MHENVYTIYKLYYNNNYIIIIIIKGIPYIPYISLYLNKIKYIDNE